MPQDTDDQDDTFTLDVTPAKPDPAPAAKPKFPPTLLKQAAAAGLTREDVDWCETVGDLREMIAAQQPRREEPKPAPASTPAPQPTPKTAEAKEEAEEWVLSKEVEWVDPSMKEELKRIGRELLKAQKRKDSEEVADLKKEIAELKERQQRAEDRNHPLFKRFCKKIAQHKDLFGDGPDEPSGTAERARYDALEKYLSGEGRMTGKPEADVDAAIEAIFPGYGVPPAGAKKKSIEELWAQGGQAPATRRNGADRTGIPGGTAAAKKKVAERMRLNGQDPGPLDDDEDDDI